MVYEFKQVRRVEFADTDMAGIVHFANFFRFMEQAEHAFYRSLGLSVHARRGDRVIGWPRVAVSCDYTAPLRFEDEVEIHLIVREKREKSISYLFVFRKVGETKEVARGTMTVASASLDPAAHTLKGIALPAEFAEKIEPAPADLL